MFRQYGHREVLKLLDEETAVFYFIACIVNI
jgi:hypothetical protein